MPSGLCTTIASRRPVRKSSYSLASIDSVHRSASSNHETKKRSLPSPASPIVSRSQSSSVASIASAGVAIGCRCRTILRCMIAYSCLSMISSVGSTQLAAVHRSSSACLMLSFSRSSTRATIPSSEVSCARVCGAESDSSPDEEPLAWVKVIGPGAADAADTTGAADAAGVVGNSEDAPAAFMSRRHSMGAVWSLLCSALRPLCSGAWTNTSSVWLIRLASSCARVCGAKSVSDSSPDEDPLSTAAADCFSFAFRSFGGLSPPVSEALLPVAPQMPTTLRMAVAASNLA
eukprot:scaffold10369_cov72-Phaeocystis_antarctica.AAC.3